jgi:hypothetical protein
VQNLAQCIIDHREENQPPIGLDAGEHAVDLAARSHHTPYMLDRLSFIKLDEAGARYRMDRIPGRIGNQVKMKPGQRHGVLTASWTRSTLGMKWRQAGETPGLIAARDTCPRTGHNDQAVINRTTTIIPIPGQPGEAGAPSLLFRYYPHQRVF